MVILTSTKSVSAPVETPLQQQFRLWQKLPSLARAPLPFDEAYQPLGWSDHYQLSLGFDDTHATRVFSIPAGKDFVNAAGAQWLQITYGDLGWKCKLSADGSALSFSYSPTGITDTIAFLLDRSGNVRLTALNTKSAIFHAAQKLSLAFVDDAVITPNLIVGAPVVYNETELTTEQLGIFTQVHENRGGYTVVHGEIRAKTTLNAAFIKATKQFNVNGHSWVNRAAITGDGRSAFVLQENLDNRGQTIQLGDSLSIQAASVNNQQGTLTGSVVRTQVTGSIDNTQGKISSTKRVRIRAQTLMNETGLISSPYGLDLRNIDDVQVGGIDTHGDVLLKEGHFTFTSATAMGNADGKTEHKINRLVIERKPVSPSTVIELIGTIKARFFRALKSTMFGNNVEIDEVEAVSDSKLTFASGQIKRLTTRMKDNPLTPELIQDLERLEWLLEDEADVLPYDVNMAGQLILRPIPGGIAIPKWLITKNAHANKGLELHLHDSDIIMGDGAGTIYPEWIADTGPLHMFGKTMDQKSGKILACAGGSIETQGKLKLGEAHQVQTIQLNPGYGHYGYLSNIQRSATSVSLGAGEDFLLKSYTSDIDFCFAHIELARFSFIANGDISFLSSKMKTQGSGTLKGTRLFLKPDDKYISTRTGSDASATGQIDYMQTIYISNSPNGVYSNLRDYMLVKPSTFVFVDGDLALDISDLIKPIGSFGVVSGKLHNICIPRQPIVPETLNQFHTSCGPGAAPQSRGSYPAGLLTSDQMIISGHKVSLEGFLSGPIIEIRTNDYQMSISGNRRPQLAAKPATLHHLGRYVDLSPFHVANPDPSGPATIHRFIHMAAPPGVYYHHGLFSDAPIPGAQLRFDHPILAQAMVEALVQQLNESYIQPHTGFKQNYVRACLNGVKALEDMRAYHPELVDETHMLTASSTGSAMEVAKKAESDSGRFGDQPVVLHVLDEDGKYTTVLHTPEVSVHRSLGRSGMLARERITIKPLDNTQPSSTHVAGGAIDSGAHGVTEIETDHNYFGPHQWTETSSHSYKQGKKRISETITQLLNHNAYLGGTHAIKGKTQNFVGTQMHIDGNSFVEGTQGVGMAPSYSSRSVQSSSSSRNGWGQRQTRFGSSFTQVPELPTVEGETGDEVLTITSDAMVALIAPNSQVPIVVNAQEFSMGVAHRTSASSCVTSSSNPFVNSVKTQSHTSDVAIAGQTPKGLTVNLRPGGHATVEHAVDEHQPNINVLGGETTHVDVPNSFTSHSKTKYTPGVATLGSLAILGSLAGGWAFTGLFGTGAATGAAAVGVAGTAGTAGVATATVGVAGAGATATALTTAEMFSISALGMAKAGTMFVGSSLFQGVATGHVNIAPRGLGIAVLTGGIMAHVSAPLAAAETTFTDMLGQQTVHAVQTAPIHTAISMEIGQEKFGDAFTASLRHGVGHAIGASLAHQMGQWYSGPDKINYFMHKMGHFASGALGGVITADDPLGGAFGAAFAEVSMEAMADAEKVSQEIYQEDPNLSISEVKAIVKERLIAKRFFSQVIAGTLAGGDFSVAANSAAIALDYNMEPTLTGAAVSAYLAQQLPALTTFLATPQGMAVAASLGIAALSIDQIKENLTLLGKLHQVYVMVLRGEVKINLMDVDTGKPKTLTTPVHEGKSVVLGTPIADPRPVLPGYEVDTDAGRSAVEGFAEYDGPGITVFDADRVEPYEVGTYDDLKGRSEPGDKLDVHHAPQKHAGLQVVPGYQEKKGPSIVLPEREHKKIPTIKGEYEGTARDLLARDIRNLKIHTKAPTSANGVKEKIKTVQTFSKEKRSLIEMAKADKKRGITSADMSAYKDLNKKLPDPFPADKVRGPEAHVSGALHSRALHGHVGPVDHIPIKG